MTTLADINEPLVLADGTKIDPSTGGVIYEDETLVEVPSHTEAVNLVTSTRRKLSDLPDVPKTMHVVSIILSYTLFGLNDTDIAIATGLTEEQIGNIKMSDTYAKFNDSIVESLLKQEQNDVRSIISQAAVTAARKQANLIHSNNEAIALAASNSILDRDGHRASDIIGQREKMEDALVFIVKKHKNDDAFPNININIT